MSIVNSFQALGATTRLLVVGCNQRLNLAPNLITTASLPRRRAYLHRQQCRTVLSDALHQKVQSMTERYAKVVEQLNEGGSTDVASLGKEMSSLAPIASLAEQLRSVSDETNTLNELLQEAENAKDDESIQECQMELENMKTKRSSLEQRIVHALLPRDADDTESDAVLEIRAGTGGDEAALFAAELLQAYQSTATKRHGWKVEILSMSKTDLGGIKEAAVSISSSSSGGSGYQDYGSSMQEDASDDLLASLGPYGLFRFESGVHRVQRVPVNDARIHTSACSVAVLPSPPQDNTNTSDLLPMSDLKIDTFRASGAGGQHVNTTESAVRITHIPTGVTAAIQDERSQHKNKQKALKLVTARVRDQLREEERKLRGDARNSLMGGGDRSERIRTYNYPQDRITDHRCKYSETGIPKLFSGGGGGADGGGLVETFAPPLRRMHRDELVKQLEDEKRQEDML